MLKFTFIARKVFPSAFIDSWICGYLIEIDCDKLGNRSLFGEIISAHNNLFVVIVDFSKSFLNALCYSFIRDFYVHQIILIFETLNYFWFDKHKFRLFWLIICFLFFSKNILKKSGLRYHALIDSYLFIGSKKIVNVKHGWN